MPNLFCVDAFTNQPFRGNPAAVHLQDRHRDTPFMQALAAEMNLSETAFLLPRGGNAYDLRWFTPSVEVDLCGHATLASAHVLYSQGLLAPNESAEFHTRSGLLTCRRTDGRLQMNFPADPVKTSILPNHFEHVLRFRPLFFGTANSGYLLAEIDGEERLRALRPDMNYLLHLGHPLIVTCQAPAASGIDFLSRFFAPGFGIPEDPVTGSAHCTLAAYWAKRLDRTRFAAHQASARGGDLWLELLGDRVLIEGEAVTVYEGELKA